MVGGFNTNVKYRGRTFHVQTEDSGPNRRHIVTLVYEGGSILSSRKTEYGDGEECGSEAVRSRMEEQHRDMVVRLKGGSLDADLGFASAVVRELGDGVVSDRRLDEVVLEHLETL